MRVFFRTRAAALALILNVGVILGVFVGAAAFAGAAKTKPASAAAYAAAAQSGYAKAAAAPSPVAAKPASPPVASLPKPTPGALDCLAAAVYYEARGESVAGRAAVAQVVLNRTRRAGYPKSICAVVYQGEQRGDCQFSFVCNGAMHGRRERFAWLDARRVAARALGGYVMTEVGKATSFHSAAAHAPSGAVRLGGHVFFT